MSSPPTRIFALNVNSLLKQEFHNDILLPHTTQPNSFLMKSILQADISILSDSRLRLHEHLQIRDRLSRSSYVHSSLVPPNAHKHAGSTIVIKLDRIISIIHKGCQPPTSEISTPRCCHILYNDRFLGNTLVFSAYPEPGNQAHFGLCLDYIHKTISSLNPKNIILGGDMNTHLDTPSAARSKKLQKLISNHLLVDSFRFIFDDQTAHPGYTFFPPDINKSPSRIDYILISSHLISAKSQIVNLDSSPFNSDHDGISLQLVRPSKTSKEWSFLNAHLDSPNNVKLFKRFISQYLCKVTSTPYNHDIPIQALDRKLELSQCSFNLVYHIINTCIKRACRVIKNRDKNKHSQRIQTLKLKRDQIKSSFSPTAAQKAELKELKFELSTIYRQRDR